MDNSSIEEELVPYGQAKDAAARNANLQPFNVAGVVAQHRSYTPTQTNLTTMKLTTTMAS